MAGVGGVKSVPRRKFAAKTAAAATAAEIDTDGASSQHAVGDIEDVSPPPQAGAPAAGAPAAGAPAAASPQGKPGKPGKPEPDAPAAASPAGKGVKLPGKGRKP